MANSFVGIVTRAGALSNEKVQLRIRRLDGDGPAAHISPDRPRDVGVTLERSKCAGLPDPIGKLCSSPETDAVRYTFHTDASGNIVRIERA